MTKPRSIDLRVRELVLDGVDPRERNRLLASLERELAGTLARGEYPRESRAHVVANAPNEPNSAALGGHIGRTIAKGGQS
jgi:hypothetical protein